MEPKIFFQALNRLTNKDPELCDRTNVNMLIHYLNREEPGKVSFRKLYDALGLDKNA